MALVSALKTKAALCSTSTPRDARLLTRSMHGDRFLPVSRVTIASSISDSISLFNSSPVARTSPRKRLKSVSLIDSHLPQPQEQDVNVAASKSEAFHRWDSLTAKLSACANLPFLLLQLPQIILNARNLLSGNKASLLALPWLGMLTGLLGNLSLLSYFAKKREKEAMVVQTLGIVSTYVVVAQLAMADAMPSLHFLATSTVTALGLLFNFLNFFGFLHTRIWFLWEDFITVAGLSVLPQVIWSTFIPFLPRSIYPGAVSFPIAVAAVATVRLKILPEGSISNMFGALSAWCATVLFMWMPVTQMWTNFLNPINIKGLSSTSMLLAMIGNGLTIPRAIFLRDLIWFTGATWATLFYGWGNLMCLYLCNCVGRELVIVTTIGLLLWLGGIFWIDARTRGG